MNYRTRNQFWMGAALALAVLPSPENTLAEIRPESVHVADSKKTKAYVKDGLIIGGDRQIDGVIVQDIRRATNPGYDRIVIDLKSSQKGEPTEIQRPPYFQVAVTPDERRLIFTLWGNPKLGFNPKKVLSAFKNSSVIQSISLLPQLENELWMFVLELKTDSAVEVFELTNPLRVIMDIQQKKTG